MRMFYQCKLLPFKKWSINLAIAFALLTLFGLTKKYVCTLYRTPSSGKFKADIKRTARLQTVTKSDIETWFRKQELELGGKQQIEEQRNAFGGGNGRGVAVANMAQTSSSSSTSPPFIIILAQWRFGSTIIGELFNQNPDVFFLFEPLYLLDQLRRDGKLPPSPFAPEVHEYTTTVLRDIGKCNVTDEYVKVMNSWGGLVNNRAVCEATKKPECKFPSAEMLNKLCASYKGLKATKVIRADLENIKTLITDDKIDVKIIHLVRDPRGSAASRIHYYFEFWKELVEPHVKEFPTLGRLAPIGLNNASIRTKDSIPTMCKWLRETTKDIKNLPEWLQGRYRLLRYEDFAEAPLNMTEELYRFVGLPLPDSVREWVRANTQAKHSASGTFDVHKNSKETARKWLSDLSELEIRQVEEECLDVMEDLGYERYAVLNTSRR